jgi:hypothetical protein
MILKLEIKRENGWWSFNLDDFQFNVRHGHQSSQVVDILVVT